MTMFEAIAEARKALWKQGDLFTVGGRAETNDPAKQPLADAYNVLAEDHQNHDH